MDSPGKTTGSEPSFPSSGIFQPRDQPGPLIAVDSYCLSHQKVAQIGKKEVKLVLFVDDMILVENPTKTTKSP